MLNTKNIRFSYGSKEFTFPDFELESGGKLLISGQSGCGKTTLLHLLAGLISPKSGEIIFQNHSFSTLKSNQRDRIRTQQMGLVWQHPVFVSTLTLMEQIQQTAVWAGKTVDSNQVIQLAELLDIQPDQLNHFPNQLSGGERQRMAVLRAIVHQPKLLLVDEASSHLDDTRTQQLMELLDKAVEQTQAALVFVSHDQRIQPYFSKEVRL